jgi:uncharacterized UPF0160 family protein
VFVFLTWQNMSPPVPHQEFIEAIDGIDNGINQYSKDAQPLYRSRTDISSRVGHLNPAWNEPSGPEVYDVRHLLTG